MRVNRTATLAIALMITPVALLRPAKDGARASSDGIAEAMSPAAQETMNAWLAALNAGVLSRLDAIVADSVRLDGRMVPRHELRRLVAEWRDAAGSREARVMPLVTDGELVGLWTWSEESRPATRSAGLPAPEPAHWLGADFLRVENGRIVEGWFHAKRLGLGAAADGG
jgi:hypothetical protein